MKISHLLFTSAALAPFTLAAQTPVVTNLRLDLGPSFFGALIAGVLIALGLQFVLTSLSTAFGISAIGNIEKKASHTKGDSSKDKESNQESRSGSSQRTPVAVSSAVGIWTAVTSCLSIFFATWWASYAFLPLNVAASIVTGLAIWALFFAVGLYLDARLMSSLLGRLMHAATSGLKQAGTLAGGLFATSQARKTQSAVEGALDHGIHKIREEVRDSVEGDQIKRKIEQFVDQMAPARFDPRELRNELADILNEIEIEETFEDDGNELKRKLILEVADREPSLSKADTEQIRKALRDSPESYRRARDIIQGEERPSTKGFKLMEAFAPGSEEDARSVRDRVVSYLRETGRDELDPDALQHDIDELVSGETQNREVIRNRLSKIDHDTIVAALQTRTDLDEEKAEKVVSYAEKAISLVREKSRSMAASAESKQSAVSQRAHDFKHNGESIENERPRGLRLKREQAEAEIARRLNRLERPELNYRSLKYDFEKIIDDPKVAPEVLSNRLSKCDRDTVVAILSAAPHITPNQAQEMINHFQSSIESVQQRAQHIKLETERRLSEAKARAYHEAETVRKTASRAAWWVSLAGILSGVSAVAGGLVGAL